MEKAPSTNRSHLWHWTARIVSAFVLLLCVASVVVALIKLYPPPLVAPFMLGALALPYLVVLVGLWREPNGIALVIGATWAILISILFSWIIIEISVRYGPLSSVGNLALLSVPLGLHIMLAISCLKLIQQLSDAPDDAWMRNFIGVTTIPVYVLVIVFIAGVISPGLHNPMNTNAARAVRSMRVLVECTRQFADAHPRLGYPADPTWIEAEEPNCLDSVLLGASTGGEPRSGYRYAYQVGELDDEGKATTFQIWGSPTDYGKSGKRGYYADETGFIRWTKEDRAATKNDPPI